MVSMRFTSSPWVLRLAVAGLLVGVSGCATENEELTRQLGELQAEIREVRGTSLATQDRLDSVERQIAALREQARETAAQNPGDRPTLPVVRLNPAEPPVSDDPATAPTESDPGAEGPRPVLRGDPSGAVIDTDGSSGGKGPRRPGGSSVSHATGGPSRAASTSAGGRQP
jgi:hypothetical protein